MENTKKFMPPKQVSAQEFVAVNLRSPTYVTRQVECITPEGERTLFDVRIRLLPKNEILTIKANATQKARTMLEKMPKDVSSVTTKEAEDELLGEYMQNEAIYRSFYNIDDDNRIFPTLESVGEMSSGNVASFAKQFWDVQATYSVSRAVLTEDELKGYDEWILSGVDLDFFFLSLSTKGAILDFMKYLVSQRVKAQQVNTESINASS